MTKRRRKSLESQVQSGCVKWFRLQYPKFKMLLFAIPNGAVLKGDYVQRAKQMNRLKSEGLVPGSADLFLSIPSGDYSGLYIEMKTPKGRQSENQKKFEESVLSVGYGYALPRSLDEFMKIVKSYLDNGEY